MINPDELKQFYYFPSAVVTASKPEFLNVVKSVADEQLEIRETLMYDDDHRLEIMGALTLYMDFINLFLSLLQLFGNKRD